MLRCLFLGFLILLLIISVIATDNEFSSCNCDEEGIWSIHTILECQKVSDFLIAIAYFSIPLELLYFISCSDVPFKWVLVQFVAFIVLCGLTHLLNGLTYSGHPSFRLIMSLTIMKILTALVSCATAITLLTLFPMLLKIKVRELFLTQNVFELDQEVGMMMKQKEVYTHVRMLTREIRKSLDKHTILYTTLVELSKTLNLQNCAVWMTNEDRSLMNLTHGLSPGSAVEYHRSLPIDDLDVLEITKNEGVRILRQDSILAVASSGGPGEACTVAAIRMPLLCVSDFKGGTPELVDTRYAILVLVIPSANDDWSRNEMEIVEVVADQVAVALSHATVLEESQLMREKLETRNGLLQQAKENAVKASQARNSFQKVMNNGMRRPMHSILGLLSILQDENTIFNQRIIIDTMVRTSSVLSNLIDDAMDIPDKDEGRFPVEMMPFQLHSMIREACCLVKCMCVYKRFGFSTDVPNSLPNLVMGDEKRTFQVILHMVGHLLNIQSGGGSVVFKVILESGTDVGNDKILGARRHSVFDEYVTVKFEIEVSLEGSQTDSSRSISHFGGRRYNSKELKEGMSLSMCKKLVQMMQGNVWMPSNTDGHAQRMTLVLRYLKQSSYRKHLFDLVSPLEQVISSSTFKGLQVLLADDDDVNRMVTKKLLEKLGCQVIAVSSGFECLSAMGHSTTSIQVVVLELHMPEMDGFTVAMRVRNFHSRSWPLIIALSSISGEQVWHRCVQVGINGLVRKPVLLQGMSEELQRVLHRAGEGF
ncbi:Ethylene receptor 2 [Capsicum baccatum]|uniref:Ethylene receptor n=1 Tax=Capsicum baccatum TaxID=33114 RepID=A0A2G2WUD6_CAPBA|nr:Ethylene receptor 2 [Capsicum baccatum]